MSFKPAGASLTEDEATTLAQRIINTMRPTPPLQDWVEELTGLNSERAWTIFRTLRQETDKGLPIATFVSAYRDSVTAERRRRAAEAAPDKCVMCNGTGFVEASWEEAHRPDICPGAPGNGCACHGVKPCRCSTGMARRDVFARILDENAKEVR